MKKIQVREFYSKIDIKTQIDEINDFLKTLLPLEIHTINDFYEDNVHVTRIYYLKSTGD